VEDKSHTILIVDDEANIVNSLKRLFRRERKYNILTAENGRAGLEIVKSNIISLIISDFRMPEMDGGEFLMKARDISPATVRFLLTGYADKEALKKVMEDGAISRHFHKPWDDNELKAAVSESLAGG